MFSGDDDLRIPPFLIMTAAERAAAWASAPPPTAIKITPQRRTVPADLPPDLQNFDIKQKQRKQQKRIRQLLASQEIKDIPPAFLGWDSARGKWIDLRVDQQRRLALAYRRLGLPPQANEEIDEMLKINIVPYMLGSDLPNPRGRTSVKEDAEPFEISAKVRSVALRVGVNKLDRIEIVKPDGVTTDTWKADENKQAMVNADGTQTVSLAPENKEEEKVAKKAAKKKSTKTKTGNGSGVKKVGIIDTIRERIALARGASINELADYLKEKFPDRKREGMIATCRIQAPKAAKRTENDEKRGGKVYYAK